MKTNKIRFSIFLILITAFLSAGLFAQDFTQTIRGKIIDQDSKSPLIGANIIVQGSDPILGSSTDIDGNFRIEKVPVGRANLQISSLGYEDKFMSNILVGSGKEVVLTIELLESVESLNEVTVSAKKNKAEVINEMSSVSAKTFSVEETNKYAGSINDPARMVSAFAGVTGDPAGNNDIVVRGNSPRGILWRLEGVEIPNPNHFANEGSTGGPVNSLNPSMLSNSDFFSGAFAPEYGNALSGVFDIYFRQGNNETREYSFTAGIIGIDFTAEGPFKKDYKGSYLVNYRYSSIDILDKMGVLDFGGIPKYQDASFKVILPTKNFGKFTLFGLGGESHILSNDEEDGVIYEEEDFNAYLGIVGLNHSYIIDEKKYIKSSVSTSAVHNGYKEDDLSRDGNMFRAMNENYNQQNVSFASTFNNKINPKNKVQMGVILTRLSYQNFGEHDFDETGDMTTLIDTKGNTGMFRAFTSWKCRLNKDLTIISGIHYTQFLLNNSYSLEPRIGAKWQFHPRQSFSLGYGIHSKPENISIYMGNTSNNADVIEYGNKDLELTKAAHYVLGYDNMLNENLHLRVELYYQHLYDIPVENDINSSFAMSNVSQYYSYRELVNEGTGRNYGVELTLERFFHNNFYYLITGSLYDSKFTTLDGVERDSRYNANYAANIIFGKEFPIGAKEKNKTLGLNLRASFLGANRYTPIDLQASIENGYTVRDDTRSYSLKGDDVFFTNISVTYRRERAKTTHELLFEVRNATNNKSVIAEYYNNRKQEIIQETQLSLIPNIAYTIKF